MGSAHCLLVVEHDIREPSSQDHSSIGCFRAPAVWETTVKQKFWEGKLMAGRALCRGMVSAEWATGVISRHDTVDHPLLPCSLLLSSLPRADDATNVDTAYPNLQVTVWPVMLTSRQACRCMPSILVGSGCWIADCSFGAFRRPINLLAFGPGSYAWTQHEAHQSLWPQHHSVAGL